MAITKIHAIKGTLNKSINYIMNEAKTEGKLLVSGLECSPEIADIEFKMTKDYYGKEDKKLAYHLIQSFAPGEIKEEKAHEVGLKLAEEVCAGKYQAVISTHVDKGHIHNHIIFNSVSHITGEKYNDCKKSYAQIRRINDELCKQHGLSVIKNPKQQGKQYREWKEIQNGSSWKEVIRKDIDEVIKDANSFDDFISKMKLKDYSIKQGKFISFKPRIKERFVRGKTLGADYTEEAIKAKIGMKELGFSISNYAEGVKVYRGKNNTYKKLKTFKRRKSLLEINMILAIDIVKQIIKKSGPKKNRSITNNRKVTDQKVKFLASQLSFMRSENITDTNILNDKINQVNAQLKMAKETLKKLDDISSKLDDISKAITSYKTNKPFYDEVNKSILKKRLKDKYQIELRTFEVAKQKLESVGIKTEDDIEVFLNKYQDHINRFKSVRAEYEDLKDKNAKYGTLESTLKKIKDRNYILECYRAESKDR